MGPQPGCNQSVAETPPEAGDTSIWGFIVSAADAISSARPGARRESLESYLKRLTALEDIAGSFQRVEKILCHTGWPGSPYSGKAGRGRRPFCHAHGARLVKKIEETLEYPGQIRITVIRETRAVDIAK
jgi:ribonuclease Y